MKNYTYLIRKIWITLVLVLGFIISLQAQTTLYSYKSGSWNDLDTWTTDPGGTTLVGSQIPTDGDEVVILSSRTVTLPNDITTTTLDITIRSGGILDVSNYSFTSGLAALRGKGKLRLSTTNFPSISGDKTFVEANGGTTEFYNTTDFEIPSVEYNNLTINLSGAGIVASQLSNITINGNLYIKQGTYKINDGTSTRLQLSIGGNVTVDSGSSLIVGNGNTTSTTSPVANNASVDGGTAPFLNYYDQNTHRIVVYGNLTNNGTVKFTNQSYPVYDAFPTDGAATVYFMGNTDNTLTCNGTTDFYNLVIDKGSDQTYQLAVNSSDYFNFRLFGANIAGGENGGDNPDLKKALWIRNGTLRLFGKVVIPSLSEGSCGDAGNNPNTDFYIPANAAFVVDGPDVVVLTTADSYQEINAAYGTSATSNTDVGINTNAGCSSFSILGKFQFDDGYISARESGGFIYWASASGEFIINGGTLDAKQFRTANASGGLTAYRQTGGTLNLRGRIKNDISGITGASAVADLTTVPLSNTQSTGGIQTAVGTFNVDRDDNIFEMTGGTINIYDVCGESGTTRAFEVNSLPAYYNVSGGTVNIIPTDGSRSDEIYYLASSAPIYNLVIDDSDASGFSVVLTDIPSKSGVTARTNPPLKVSNDLTLSNNAIFNAAGYEVQIGGDFNFPSGCTYTTGSNWTTFNGSGYQTFTGGGTIDAGSGFHKFKLDKSDTLLLDGVPASYTVQDSLNIEGGVLDDNGKTLNVGGDIYNAGVHTGTGKIVLNGSSIQYLEESVFGSPTLGNVELNNANNAQLVSDFTMYGFTFNSGIVDINQYRLTVEAGGVSGYSSTLYFYTNGLISDGGLRMEVDASTLTTGNNIVYPIGTTSGYTPATIEGNTTPGTSTGYVTFLPVDSEHPARNTSGQYLLYYWKSIAEGMPATSNVYYTFTYHSNIPGGINRTYALLEGETTWQKAQTITGRTLSLNDPAFTEGFISAEVSAGNNGAFNNIQAYYSIGSGAYNSTSVWSTTGHTGASCNCSPSSSTDIVFIGGDAATNRNDSITVTAGFSAAIITINGSYTNDERRPVLNIQNLGGSITVNNIKGGGKFTTTSATLTSANMGDFLTNDSAQFNYHNVATAINGSITSYPNLYISSTGTDVSTLINADILVDGDLKIASSGGGNTLRFNNAGGNLIVYGDIQLDNAASLEFDGSTAQRLDIYGNIDLNYDGSGSDANLLGVNTGTAAHEINFYGDSIIIGASSINVPNGTLNILDSLNTTVTDGSGSILLNYLTINKNSLSNTVTISEDFTLNASTNSSPKALTLSSGTLILENANTNINLTSGGADFEIPQTAALVLKNGASVNTTGSGTGIFLDGLLSAEGTSAIDLGDGSTGDTRYIEYSGSGNAEINLSGNATLTVNSQIRRSLSQTNGVLKFTQSGTSSTVIYGRGGSATRAKFEVLNSGSEFYLNGGTFNVIRGGGTTYGDFYLRPESGTSSGGTITLGSENVGIQTVKFDATIPIYSLILDGVGAMNTFQIMVNPLIMYGDLTINTANSTLDANDIDVTLKGDLTNNGIYDPGTNTTTFNGTTQEILGSTITDFYNLISEPTTSLTFNYDVTIANDLSINTGTLLTSTYNVFVAGNFVNNGIHSGNASQGGVILNGSAEQAVSGSGTFGRLNLYNSEGARLLNNITLNQDLLLSDGVFNINQYLLTLGTNAEIIDTTGTGFSSSKMIEPDGVFSNIGIKKNYTSGAQIFTYPLGVNGKYTPADLTISASSAGSIRINCINDNHPTVLDDTQVLQYYWEIESSGISGFEGDLKLKYDNGDVLGTESDYVAARLIIPDGTTWSKATPGSDETDNTYETNDSIYFNFPAGTNNLSGEYTAGTDAAIPSTVPTYVSNSSGDWDDVNIWTPVAPAGGPNGFIVEISDGDSVNTNGNRRFAYKTEINGVLDVQDSYGHNLGTVSGTGKLRLEGPILPAGRFNSFLSCSGGTLEYAGNTDYTIIADRLDTLRNIYFTGSGKRILADKDLVICDTLRIDGATLDNSVNNRKLTVNGVFQRLNSGVFTSGTGAGATVVFAGNAQQTIGGADGEFTGVNKFNNFELNNSAGLVLNSPLEINEDLILTDGIITSTTANILRILNPGATSTVTPNGGSSSAYIDGPMSIYIYGGNDFVFPLGDGSRYGKLHVLGVDNGTWTAEYFNTGYIDLTVTGSLNEVSQSEYWAIDNPTAADRAKVEVRWDSSSDITPLTTTNGISDIVVAEFDGSDWIDKASDAPVGDDYNGTVRTTNTIDIDPTYYTLGSKSAILAKAYFTNADDVCDGASIPVSFSGVTTGDLNFTISYTIDGNPQTDITVTGLPYSLPTSGAGVYQLTAFTYSGGTSGVVDNSTVVVNTTPSPLIVPSQASQTFCAGETTNYSVTNNAGNTYNWSVTGGTILSGQGTNTISVEWLTGAGDVIVTETSPEGCSGTDNINPVTVNPLPETIDQTPADLCSEIAGENAQVTGIDLTLLESLINTDGSGDTFTWYEDAALTALVATPSNVTINVTINGGAFSETEDFYCVVENSGNTCSNVAVVIYTINRIPETGPQYHLNIP